MKMKCCWALLSALVILTAMATMADGCSCAKRHPQEHYCSADFGTYFSQIIIMAECCTYVGDLFNCFFLNKFDFHVCVQWFWLMWRGSCTTDLNGPALTRCASRKSSRWRNPVVRPCLTDAYWRLHTTLRAVSDSNRDVATCWRETSAPVNLGSICVILFTTGIVWRPSSAKVSVVSINADAIARYNIQTNSKL